MLVGQLAVQQGHLLGAEMGAPGDTRSRRDVVVWSLSPTGAAAAVKANDRSVRILAVVKPSGPNYKTIRETSF